MACEVYEAAKYCASILGKEVSDSPPCGPYCNLTNGCRVYDNTGLMNKKEIIRAIESVALGKRQLDNFYRKLEAHFEVVGRGGFEPPTTKV